MSRAETGQATFLVDGDGTIQGASTSLTAFLGAGESHPTDNLYEQLAEAEKDFNPRSKLAV